MPPSARGPMQYVHWIHPSTSFFSAHSSVPVIVQK